MTGELPDLDEAISFAVDAGQQAGPFAMREIIDSVRSGLRAPNTLVWWAGEADWVPFDSVGGLVQLLGAPADAPEDLPPPPAAAPAPEPVIEEPVIEEPVMQEPAIEEPVFEEPVVDAAPVEDAIQGMAAQTEDLSAAPQEGAMFGGLQPLTTDDSPAEPAEAWNDTSAAEVLSSEPMPEASADPWRDLPAPGAETEVITGDELAADFSSVADSGSGLFETEPAADVFAGIDDGMDVADPADVDISESVSGAFDAVAETAEEAEDAVEASDATATMQVDDFADTNIDVLDGNDLGGFEEAGDFVSQSSDPIAAADDTVGQDVSSLQSVSERIDALGSGALAGGILGSGRRMDGGGDDAVESVDAAADEVAEFADATEVTDLAETTDFAEVGDVVDATELDDVVDAPAEAEEALFGEVATAETVDELDAEPAFTDAVDQTPVVALVDDGVDADDAEVDAALSELDEIAEESAVDGESVDGDDVAAEDGEPEVDDALEDAFRALQATTSESTAALEWAPKLDDVLLGVVVTATQADGYGLVDLHSAGTSHLARFENRDTASRTTVGVEQAGPTAGHLDHQHMMVFVTWGRPVAPNDMPDDNDDGAAGVISTYGDAETGYAYSAVDLMWTLEDYLDPDDVVNEEKVRAALDATRYALRRHWYSEFG